jgi:hypothetical protein
MPLDRAGTALFVYAFKRQYAGSAFRFDPAPRLLLLGAKARCNGFDRIGNWQPAFDDPPNPEFWTG